MPLPMVKLGQVADFINGDRGANYPSESDFVKNGIPFINAGHLVDGEVDFSAMNYITENRFNRLGSGKTKPNDILYCLRGSLGKTAIVHTDREAAIASSLVIIRPSGECSAEYLYHFLTSPLGRIEIRKFDNGSSQPNLSANSVKNYLLPLPPLKEQRRIAEVLDRAKAVRAKRRNALSKLDFLAQSLFLDLFGDPATNPKAWRMSQLAELCEIAGEYGANVSAEPYNPELPRYVRITDITNSGELTPDAVSPGGARTDYEAYRLREGDLLFARSGATVGKTYLHHNKNGDCVFAGYLIRFRPRREEMLPEFLFSFTKTASYASWVKARQRVVAQPNINAKQYGRELKVPVPPMELQRGFTHRMAAVEKLKVANRASLAELDALFASLQHRAFRGEL
jgi:type I restriction enzyme, S subunit